MLITWPKLPGEMLHSQETLGTAIRRESKVEEPWVGMFEMMAKMAMGIRPISHYKGTIAAVDAKDNLG